MPPEAQLQSDLRYMLLHSLSGVSMNVSTCFSNEFLSERLNGLNIVIKMVCLE